MSGCYRYLEMMQREFDGELSELEKKILEKHLTQCPFCREEYAAFRVVENLFEGVEMLEPPVDLTDLIMAEVLQLEPGTEPVQKELNLIGNLKGIGLLIALAGINAALYGSWVISLIHFPFHRPQLQLMYRILVEAFTHFEIIGRHTGHAFQTVVTAIVSALPWEWIGLYITCGVLIMLGTWIVNRKGGDQA